MKVFIFSLLVWASSQVFSQNDRGEMYLLSGNIYQTSINRGGGSALWEDVHMIYPNLIPYRSKTMLVVALDTMNSFPVVITEITSDDNGFFEIALPPGIYGFIEPADSSIVRPGQYLPNSHSTTMNHISYSSSWEISTEGPIDLRKGSLSQVSLFHHSSSFCVDCP